MNTTSSTHFEVVYSRELLEDAARCFISKYFRRDGRWLLPACVVNVIGIAAAIALGATETWMILGGTMVAVTGPLYCIYLFASFPKQYAANVTQTLAPRAELTFTDSTLEVLAKGKNAEIPWTSIKEVWECPAAFVLVFSQHGKVFAVIPKNDLPPLAHELLARKAGTHAA
jgi:hypothetical protein